MPEDDGSARRPLRVAQLIESLGMGGAERLAVQIANARAEVGDDSSLVVMTGPGPLSARVAPAVRVRYLGYRRASVGNPVVFALSLARGRRLLAGQLARDGVEVVQSHLPGANFWGLLLAVGGRAGVIPTVHNNQEFRYGREDQVWRARLRRRAYREMLRRCAAVVAVSDEVRVSLARDLGATAAEAARIRVIPNGVEIPGPGDAATRARVRDRWGAVPGEALLLAAGRHGEQKNFAALVEAVALLRARGRAVRAVVAGDGPLRDALAARARELGVADRVALPGNLDDLGETMQGADAFVLPSLWEGLPLVLLEAMARGTPVVGTRIPGIAEVLGEEEAGWLAAPADPADLARTLERLLDDPAGAAVRAAAGLARVRRDFDFARVSADLGRLYAEVARR
jgi:glycosyltransferase involved in cell wall biosynthesis